MKSKDYLPKADDTSYFRDDPAYTLNKVLEGFKGAYWQWDFINKKIHWSYQAPVLLNLPMVDDTQAQSDFLSRVHLNSLPALLEKLEMAPNSSSLHKLEIALQQDDDQVKWYEMIIFPGQQTDERNRFIKGAILDINARKKFEQRLMDHQYLLDEAGRIADLGAWEIDMRNQQLSWSSQVYEIHEVPENYSPTLEKAFSFYVGSSKSLLEREFQRSLDEFTPFDLELRFRTYKGKKIWVRAKGEPVVTEGKVTLIRGIFQDITREKQYLETLQEQEALFHNAFQYAPIGKAVLYNNSNSVKINDRLKELLGYPESYYQNIQWDRITYPEDLEKDRLKVMQLVEGKIDYYAIEKRLIHRDGHFIWTHFSRSIVRNSRRKAVYEIVQVQDINAQKALELEKSHTIDALTIQNNRLNNFAHIVSHNLRSHSSNLEMLCQLLDIEEEPAEKEKLLNNIRNISKNLSTTIGHLAEVVKVTQDIHKQRHLISLDEVLNRTLQVLEGQISQHEVQIDANFSKCPRLNYAPAYLDSIFLNLISNAIKYRSPKRSPAISLRTFRENGRCHFICQDNGLGIDLEKYGHKLFGLYKTFHENKDAQGVGLFLTKNQVEAMGGSIRVESQVDKGTTFTIMF
jgi:PAS domain S-box-containing protein